MPPSSKSSKLTGLWNSLAQMETAATKQPNQQRENQVKLDNGSKLSRPTPTQTATNQPTKQRENQVIFDNSSKLPGPTPTQTAANLPTKQRENQVIFDNSSKHSSPTQTQTEDHQSEASNDNGEISTETKSMAKSTRRRWKPEEISRLVKLRGELNEKFQSVKGRMVLWEQISSVMLSDGMERSAAQCKSLWASLVQKYEVCIFSPKVFLLRLNFVHILVGTIL
jgi:Myb/SANT-like DNA-binding domain